jgi:hypothetical protein
MNTSREKKNASFDKTVKSYKNNINKDRIEFDIDNDMDHFHIKLSKVTKKMS